MNKNFQHGQVTASILQAFYTVYNSLGHGFREKVYENAMVVELTELGMKVDQQQGIKVFYKGVQVGYYVPDLIINGVVVTELKATASLCEDHEAQLVNCLKASESEVGLLLNFGIKPEFKRKAFANEYKKRY